MLFIISCFVAYMLLFSLILATVHAMRHTVAMLLLRCLLPMPLIIIAARFSDADVATSATSSLFFFFRMATLTGRLLRAFHTPPQRRACCLCHLRHTAIFHDTPFSPLTP